MDSLADIRRIDDVAAGMLKRYRTPRIAREMAFEHAMDYPPNHDKRVYWLKVYETIIAMSPDIKW